MRLPATTTPSIWLQVPERTWVVKHVPELCQKSDITGPDCLSSKSGHGLQRKITRPAYQHGLWFQNLGALVLRNLPAVFIAFSATLIAIGIGFSFLSAHLPLADSISHFRLHLTVALFVAAVFLAMLSSWPSAFTALVVVMIGMIGLGSAIPSWQSADAASNGRSLKVLQINLLFSNRTSQPIVDLIRREKPDIVTMQELGRNAQPVIARLATDYTYRIVCRARRFANVAILSRWPRASKRSAGCARGLAFAWLRVVVNGQPLSVATVHLNWPYPFDQWQHIDALENKLTNLPRPVLSAATLTQLLGVPRLVE